MHTMLLAVLVAAAQPRQTIEIAVNAQNQVFVAHRQVPLSDLRSYLLRLRQTEPDAQAFIEADAHSYYGTVLQVRDAVESVKLPLRATPGESVP